MAEDRTNRVDVQIRLLQDEQMKLFEQTIGKFETSVTSLIDRIDALETGRRPTSVGRAGDLSGRQSDPAGQQILRQIPLNALFAGAGAGGTLGGAGGISPRASAPAPSGGGIGRYTRFGYDQPLMNEFERAQFSLGNVGQGWLGSMRYTSHILQRTGQAGGQYEMVKNAAGAIEWHDTQGNVVPPEQIPPWRRGLVGMGGGVGAATRFATQAQGAAQGGWTMLTGAFPVANVLNPQYMQQMAQYGVGVGESRAGWLGTPFGSPAWKTGAMAEWQAYRRSRWSNDLNWNPAKGFGLFGTLMGNPNYSSAQAQEAIQITNQYGWKGATQDRVIDVMKSYTQRFGDKIPQEMMMQLMEPALRYGTSSFSEVSGSLDMLAVAAEAAHMNLGEFAQQAMAAAQQLSEATGVSGPRALGQVAAYVAATGRPASEAGAVLGNKRNLYLGMALTGQNLYQAFSKNPAAAATAGEFAMLGPLGDPESWKGLKKGDPAWEQKMIALQAIYNADPSLLGGMTPDQWFKQMQTAITRGVTPGAMVGALAQAGDVGYARMMGGKHNPAAMANLRSTLKLGGIKDPKIQAAMHAITTGEDVIDPFHGRFGTLADRQIWKLMKDNDLGGSIDNAQEAKRLTLALLGKKAQVSSDKATKKTQYKIGVQAPYDKIFKVMINNEGGRGHANAALGFARSAVGGINVAGIPVGDLGWDAGEAIAGLFGR